MLRKTIFFSTLFILFSIPASDQAVFAVVRTSVSDTDTITGQQSRLLYEEQNPANEISSKKQRHRFDRDQRNEIGTGPAIEPGLCSRLTDKQNRSECFSRAALQNNDTALCSEIPEGINKSRCIQKVAQQTRNIAMCDGIRSNSQRERCYAGLAGSLSDESICDQRISDPKIKDLCWKKLLRQKRFECCDAHCQNNFRRPGFHHGEWNR